MLMLRKTHLQAMQTADADHAYAERRKDSDHRHELDKLRARMRAQCHHIADIERKLSENRLRIANLETSLEFAETARDNAITQFNALVLGPVPFKWGADPAPEAKKAHLVDSAMALPKFPVICPDFDSLETRVAACPGWGFFDPRNPLRYVPLHARYPYAGGPTITGRMPGAGSVKP